MTRNTSPNAAWRAGLSLDLDHVDTQQTRTDVSPGVDIENTVDGPDRGHYGFGIDLLRLKRFQAARRVGFELGIGPQVNYLHDRTTEATGDSLASSERVQTVTNTFFGLAARFGAEVFLARSISVHAHYGLHAGYAGLDQKSELTARFSDGTNRSSTVEVEGSRWTFEQEGVLFGLSVYL